MTRLTIDTTNFETEHTFASVCGLGMDIALKVVVKSHNDAVTTTFCVTSNKAIVYDGPSLETAIRKYNATYDALTLL